jgi:gamma-glutamyltranspeptidase
VHRAGLSAALAAACGLAAATGSATAQQRPDVAGLEAAVVADHPLAAAAGAEVLRRGGNAVDAAITMAAVLAVVRPHMNGLGGDAFMLYRESATDRVHGLNGSGRSAELATAAALIERGFDAVPQHGPLSVSVPGALRLWADALRRFGTIPLDSALAPAIRIAEQGFAVSAKLAADLGAARATLEADPAMQAVFLPNGEVPPVGSLLQQRDLAQSLRLVARDGADVLYVGEIAQRIDAFFEREGGLLRIDDLAAHSTLWQDPIATTYHDFRVLTMPPNSQGLALLQQMNMARLFDLRALGHNTTEYAHTLAELTRLAFEERDAFVADPAFHEIPLERLLSSEHARRRIAELQRRGDAERPAPPTGAGDRANDDGDTVFLGVVDSNGNAVSMIQSLFHSFGSGRMVPGTGIVLHNRGSQFTLDTLHTNVLTPRKRPYHTLTPALALRPDGSTVMVFGTPGGDGQTQTLLQVFNNVVVFGMTPQQAVEAARWRVLEDGTLLVEEAVPESTLAGLDTLGHRVRVQPMLTAALGGAQIILMLPTGVRMVGADPRREAYGIAW